MIKVICSGCQKVLAVKDANAGKKGKCPGCGAVIFVPTPGGVAKSKPPALPQKDDEEEGPDPVVAMASQAASSAISVAGSAASAVGNAMTGIFRRSTEVIETTIETPSWLSAFTRDNQSPDVIKKVVGKVNTILMVDEQLTYIAVQNRPIVNLTPDCLALTNKRFIFYRPKLLGRVVFEDYVWRNLYDARLAENVIGATITVATSKGDTLSLDYLPKEQARAVYRIMQEMEERSLDDRRNRDLEEKRAAAGAVTVQTNLAVPVSTATQSANNNADPIVKLQKLKTMLDAGLITPAEYDAKKADILASM